MAYSTKPSHVIAEGGVVAPLGITAETGGFTGWSDKMQNALDHACLTRIGTIPDLYIICRSLRRGVKSGVTFDAPVLFSSVLSRLTTHAWHRKATSDLLTTRRRNSSKPVLRRSWNNARHKASNTNVNSAAHRIRKALIGGRWTQ